MTRSWQFYLVDVFAPEPLTGNPLSLVVDADDLTEPQMKAIAREFNQSETTFLVRPTTPSADWRLRSFTPVGAEVLGAGHNALGAWLWLAHAGKLSLEGASTLFAQEIGSDVLPVEVIQEPGQPIAVSMDQSAPSYGGTVTDRAELAAALGLTEDDLVRELEAQVVDTGAGHLMVPVRSRDTVDRAAPDSVRLASVLREVGGEGCYVYSLDPIDPAHGSIAYTRFFNPTVGITEDPATGTAAGPLVASLVAGGHAEDDGTYAVEQGHALGRPSRISVSVSGERVRVSGSGIVVAEGTLSI